jgi:hypothetical protein
MRRWRVCRRWAGMVGMLAGASQAQAQGGGSHDQLRPELLGGVVLSIIDVRQSHDMGLPAATMLRERLTSVFAVGGFEMIRVEAPYALAAVVGAAPGREEGVGFERQVSALVDVTLQLTYRPTNEIMYEWVLQLPGTGRDRADAIDNAMRQLRGNTTRYVELARDARLRVLQHAESTCEALRTRVTAKAGAGAFEGAIAELLLVPDEAVGCHRLAVEDATALLTARFGQQPDSLLASRAASVRTTHDPIRTEWPLIAGTRLAVEYGNANRRSQQRGQSIW